MGWALFVQIIFLILLVAILIQAVAEHMIGFYNDTKVDRARREHIYNSSRRG